MRKLKLQMQISIDGYIAGINGEMDWMARNWGDDIKAYVNELTAPVDLIIMGRKLAQGFIPHWASMLTPEADDFTRKMVETPKVVFTKTLSTSNWDYTTLANYDLKTEITMLKAKTGSDIIVYGGGSLAAALIEENLVDELNLFVNPTALGNGIKIFIGKTPFKLVNSQSFECGIVALKYQKL